jgi:hypothetical protein
VLTKDNVKLQLKGFTKCCFCTEQEIIQHLFFYYPMARVMWGIVCVTFGVANPVDGGICLVLGLEVFLISKGTLY